MKSSFLIFAIATMFISSCKHESLLNPDQTPQLSLVCSDDTVYFQQKVLPIFISNCAMSGCHDNVTRKEGLDLTSYVGIMNSGSVHAFQPLNSKAYKLMIETNAGDRMPPPPYNALSQEQINYVYTWIQQGARNNSCQSACDSSQFTFSASIKPLLALKCQGCHSGNTPQGSIDLSSYASIKARINDGRLWGSVNHMTGYSPMPKNGAKLSACELSQIKNWMDTGAPEN